MKDRGKAEGHYGDVMTRSGLDLDTIAILFVFLGILLLLAGGAVALVAAVRQRPIPRATVLSLVISGAGLAVLSAIALAVMGALFD